MVKLNLRLPDELHAVVVANAAKNHRSLNSEILAALEFYLKNAPGAHYEPAPPPKEKSAKTTKPK